MVWRRKDTGEGSILGCEGASGIGKARRKTAGCTAGPTERILRLRGNMDGAVKLLRAWKLCSEPESHGNPGSRMTCGRGRTGVGSDVAAEAGGWDANNSGVKTEGLRSVGDPKRCAVEVKARWSGRRVPRS